MKILIEEETYPIELLTNLFDDPKFYIQNGLDGKITSVGYYHSFEKNSLVFMLPKVFMKDGRKTVFEYLNEDESKSNYSKEQLLSLIDDISIKHKTQYNWVRQLSVHFYNSLLKYKRKYNDSLLINSSETFDLNTNIGLKEYSFLDLLLSFVNFYNKNKNQILFKHIEFQTNQVKKPKWDKTIRKSLPLLFDSKTPIYLNITNKKKVVNNEEELMTYFFSILNRFNEEHHLNLKFDKSYKIIKGHQFDNLCNNGLSKLRKIKYKYFSDTLRKMYVLCEMYFTQFDKSSIKKKREDFISISNYNIVFEEMVDALFSSELENIEVDGISLKDLKKNDDGKIIDHIYDYRSLIDTSDIFYIGDSKYYKSDNHAGKVSKYKQFTYAKNVIQFNIDLLNKNEQRHQGNLRYRDLLTEGYNISPNFFIYGYIDDVTNYEKHSIEQKGDPIESFHFEDRLFDRDTLFVHQYKINFLYVLKAYTTFNNLKINEFRKEVKEDFRGNFIKYFNDSTKCKFTFYKSKLKTEEYKDFIDTNFKNLNGKCFMTKDNKLLLAKHGSDETINGLLTYFENSGPLV